MLKVSRSNKNRRIILFAIPFFTLLSFGVFLSLKNNLSNAVKATDFNPGRIIDDEIFYNKDAMTAQQIQEFLNKQIGNCDTWGTQRATDWGRGDITRAQYAKQAWGIDPPFVCLNNYHENPETKETSYEKGGGAFEGGISAARIIYDASQEYGINPQVLLVMLKKESAGPLTGDTWPLKNQYKYAMGYACPDSGANYTAACQESKAGFYNQIMLSAWQLKYYKDNKDSYHLKLGVNKIQYSPNPACGTKTVNIENVATLSLYIYTPYTPNDTALANYPGTSNCGAYGNRNFFMFFNEWFSPTTGEKVEIINSNVTVADDAYTISASSGLTFDVSGGSSSNGASIQIYSPNETSAQQFIFSRQNDGFYIIKNTKSGKVLDATGGAIKNGTKIQQYDYNGTCAQKWSLQRKANGKFEILSACNGLKALDISNGSISTSGTKLQLYTRNDTNSQEFNLTTKTESFGGEYYISNIQSNKSINVTGNSSNDGTSASIWSADTADAYQKFEITRYDGVFYKIKNLTTQKYLEISGDSSAQAVQFWSNRGNSCQQLWSIISNNDSYIFKSACAGGYVVDITGGNVSVDGIKLQSYEHNGTAAQHWSIKSVSSYDKQTLSIKTGLVIDVTGKNFSNKTSIQIYSPNKTEAQDFVLEQQSTGLYVIKSSNGKVLDITDGSIKSGTKLQLYDYNGTCAQKWSLAKNSNDSFTILSSCNSNLAIDVTGGAISTNGTKLQVYTKNDTASQQWYLKAN